jgi:diguanylate cyclase (GGDEF)-like protein/PAS domain S-box-containing protein
MLVLLFHRLSVYAVAILLVAAAFFFTQQLLNTTTPSNIFLLFFGAILATAWLGGFAPTVFATLLAALVCNYFFLEPAGSFKVPSAAGWIPLLIFVAEGVSIGLMSGVLKASRQRTLQVLSEVRRHENELLQIKSDLEARVQRRTAEFRAAKERAEQELAERQRTEASLHESQLRFQAIFNNTFQFMGLASPSGILIEVNQTALDFAGIRREDVVGKWLGDTPWWVATPESRDRLHEWVTRAAGGAFIREEVPLVGRDRQTLTIDFSLKPIKNEQGAVVLLIPEGRDITENKRAWEALRRSEERFNKFFRASPAAMSITTLGEGRFLDANESMLRLYGYTREEVIGHTALELGMWVEGKSRGRVVEQLQRYGFVHSVESQVRVKSGELRDVISSLEIVDLDGTPVLLGTTFDLTDRKRAEAEMLESHRQVVQYVSVLEKRNREMQLLNAMNDLLQAAQNEGEAYQVMVRYLAQLFPQEAGALYMLRASRNLAERVVGWGHAPPQAVFIEPGDCWALRRGRLHRMVPDQIMPVCQHVEQGGNATNGTICAPLMAFGETLGVLQILIGPLDADAGNLTDRYEPLMMAVVDQLGLAIANLKLREHLRFQAIRDPLTGLYNRRFMQETLHHELHRARLSAASIGIMMIDIDHFKQFNDLFGHQAGDMVLKAVGTLLAESGGALQVACRYGGEEFALIVPDASLTQVVAQAEALRSHIKKMVLHYGSEALGTVTISVGVAMYPADGSEPEVLLHHADRALYLAKQAGRDQVVVCP